MLYTGLAVDNDARNKPFSTVSTNLWTVARADALFEVDCWALKNVSAKAVYPSPSIPLDAGPKGASLRYGLHAGVLTICGNESLHLWDQHRKGFLARDIHPFAVTLFSTR